MTSERPLTEKQHAFIAAYVGEAQGNATKAARIAGYAGNDATLAEQGRRVLGNVGVKQALDRFRAELNQGRRASAERVHEFLTDVMEGRLVEVTVTVNKHGEFVENAAPPRVRDRIAAALGLAKVCGYEAPTRIEATVAPALDPETEQALIEYLRIKRNPVEWQAFVEYRRLHG